MSDAEDSIDNTGLHFRCVGDAISWACRDTDQPVRSCLNDDVGGGEFYGARELALSISNKLNTIHAPWYEPGSLGFGGCYGQAAKVVHGRQPIFDRHGEPLAVVTGVYVRLAKAIWMEGSEHPYWQPRLMLGVLVSERHHSHTGRTLSVRQQAGIARPGVDDSWVKKHDWPIHRANGVRLLREALAHVDDVMGAWLVEQGVM